ncbi:MAG: Uncharacterized protein G01um10145_647 [Microgenomates group bacterium Gr01-1014_5]|nr:MAG: Uncharacterized protein G01um10145_647 [Microgenomates group bacterium Gr01-1014_5]
MSKYFLGLIIVILILTTFLFIGSNLSEKKQEPSPSSKGDSKNIKVNQLDLIHNGSNYRINWEQVAIPKNIILGTNLDEKKTAETLFSENQCKVLTNGGFYTESDNYIGLLYIDGKKLSNESSDPLFNGVFYITNAGDPGIGSGVPLTQIKYAVQSGPILVRYRTYQKLKLASDQGARRIVIALTDKKAVYFMAVFDPNSTYLGPLLTDLPEIVKKFAEGKNLSFTDALNLDGGSHSAFLTPGVSLDELSPIGSYLCARDQN